MSHTYSAQGNCTRPNPYPRTTLTTHLCALRGECHSEKAWEEAVEVSWAFTSSRVNKLLEKPWESSSSPPPSSSCTLHPSSSIIVALIIHLFVHSRSSF